MSMSPFRRRAASRRGMTLLETMIVVVLAAIVIAAATALLLAGGRVVHNTEHTADSHDNSRIAAESIMNLVRQAGAGAPGGLWVVRGGTPVRTNPIFGRDGTTGAGTTGNIANPDGSDDLWLVLPDPNYMGEPCSLTPGGQPSGAAVPVTKAGTGALNVNCVASLRPGALHVASNMTTAALLSNVQVVPENPSNPGQVLYDEQGVSGFSDAPEKGGFQSGDWVYPVRLVHFYLAINPTTGRNALYRAEGRVAQDALGRPYSDDGATPPLLVQDYVEDFQVSFGFDTKNLADPDQYTWSHGLAPEFAAGLRSVRVSVVATGSNPRRDSQSVAVLSADKPMDVENHTQPPAVVADGFFRSLYTRRVELPNLAAASL
ncbi:PilW family protein [Pyxidicoccus parkwayensis]|uniref:PilW family protein n=1 Tax=Pyxidicoccus parkwayensis TaxID=2813578 RepID=A0ABX7NN73_9BACT|nr:PilW family protein [Pyxidicoccus parkwaysis]QSQ19858.1 PilW family protein [Pyxidicoccus parkwaysis]